MLFRPKDLDEGCTCQLLWTGLLRLQPLREGNLTWEGATSEFSTRSVAFLFGQIHFWYLISLVPDTSGTWHFWYLILLVPDTSGTWYLWYLSQALYRKGYLSTGLREVTDQTKTELASDPESPEPLLHCNCGDLIMIVIFIMMMMIAWCNVGSVVALR